MKVDLSHLELFCRDTASAAAWWIHAFDAALVADQGPFQWVEVGGVELLLRPGDPASSPGYRSASTAIVFAVEDVAVATAHLTAKGVAFGHGDEDDCLTLQDSEGHWIQVTAKG